MENIILQEAIEIIKRWNRHSLASTIVLLGPPESGKTAFLKRLINFCDRENSYGVIALHIDLRIAPINTEDDLYKYIVETLVKESISKFIITERPVFQTKYDLAFEHLVELLLEQTASKGSYVTLFFDHIDYITFEFARKLVHRLRFFNDKASIDYRRLGLCIAGIKSLFDLRKFLNSPYASYKVIKFPQQNSAIRSLLVREQIEEKGFKKRQINQYSKKLEELTGGETVFLQPLLNYFQNKSIDINNLESAAEYIYEQDISVFRHIALRVWSDSNLKKTVEDLLENRLVPAKGNNPDIDEYQLTGAFILPSQNTASSQRMYYQFRNELVKQFLTKLIAYLNNNLLPNNHLAVINQILRLKNIDEKCRKANNLSDFFNNLETAWKEITDFTIYSDDLSIKCYIADRTRSYFWRIQTKPQLVIDNLKNAPEPYETQIEQIIEDWKINFADWGMKKHTFFHWTDEIVTFTYTLSSFDNFLVALSVFVPKHRVTDEFTEFTLSHWIRFIKKHKNKILELILWELGKDALKNGVTGQQIHQKSGDFSVIDTLSANRSQNTLYWTNERENFLVTPSKFIFLEGNPPTKSIEVFNEECQEVFNQHLNFTKIKKFLGEKTENLLLRLSRDIKNFEQLCKISDRELLCIESYIEGMKIPFELIPVSEKEYLGTKVAVSRRLRFNDIPQIFHSSFHIKFAKLKLRGESFRVLVVANTNEGTLKQVENEARIIENELSAAGIDVDVTIDKPIEEIESILKEKNFHLLHFCGDAKYYRGDESLSGLKIPSLDDETSRISYGRFAEAVKNSGLWLIYLSCCHGAVTDRPEIGQTYLNCMEALIRAGIANVIGFRWAVEDIRAKRFAGDFYRELFKDNQVKDLSLAMLETRRKLWNQPQFPDVVASSILIMQSN